MPINFIHLEKLNYAKFQNLWGGMNKAQKIHCRWGVRYENTWGLVKFLKSVWVSQVIEVIDCHSIKKSRDSTTTSIYRGQTISTGQSQFYFSKTYLLTVVINRQLWCYVSVRSSLGHLINFKPLVTLLREPSEESGSWTFWLLLWLLWSSVSP